MLQYEDNSKYIKEYVEELKSIPNSDSVPEPEPTPQPKLAQKMATLL
jgi:hypothetical protein